MDILNRGTAYMCVSVMALLDWLLLDCCTKVRFHSFRPWKWYYLKPGRAFADFIMCLYNYVLLWFMTSTFTFYVHFLRPIRCIKCVWISLANKIIQYFHTIIIVNKKNITRMFSCNSFKQFAISHKIWFTCYCFFNVWYLFNLVHSSQRYEVNNF